MRAWSRYDDNALANPYLAADRGYVDRVIMPHETRGQVVQALRALRSKREGAAAEEAWEHPLVSARFEVVHGNPGDEELAVVISLLSAAML